MKQVYFFHGMFEEPIRCARYFKDWKGYKIRIPDLERENLARLRKELTDAAKVRRIAAIGHSAGCAWLLHATKGIDIRKILVSPVVEYSQMPWGYRIYRKLHIRNDWLYRHLIKYYCGKLRADVSDMKTYLPSAKYLYMTRTLLKKGPVLDGEIVSVICSDDPVVDETPASLGGAKTVKIKGSGHGLSKKIFNTLRRTI